jgi:carbon-monoxide dehydrogenase large subunit
MGSAAVIKAGTEVREKAVAIAAHLLQVKPADVALADGVFQAGEATLPFSEVASAAYLHPFLLPPGMDVGLVSIAAYDPGTTGSFPDAEGKLNIGGTHSSQSAAAIVEVDVNTGKIHLRDFVLAHDVGRVINPLLLEGQIQGSFAQGIGAALLEEFVYDDQGQPLTTTLLDYAIPGFGDVPAVRSLEMNVPSELPGGFRGVGQIATIMAPAAIASAVTDALRPFGVRIRHSGLGPARLRDLLREAGVGLELHVGGG